jgi:DNA polymerase (family 10)
MARAAVETGTALEINAAMQRLDLKDQHARLAHELGVKICIDTDAHHTAGFEQLRFGVLTARRAGIRRRNVVNTWTAKQIRKFVAKKRGGQ